MIIIASVIVGALVVLELLSFTGAAPARGPDVTELPGCPDSPNCVSSQNASGEHAVEPLQISGEPASEWERAKAVVADLGGQPAPGTGGSYARFEFRSRTFGFVDDLELLLNGEDQRIEIRSASRSGYSDMGVNRRRVETIRERMNSNRTVR